MKKYFLLRSILAATLIFGCAPVLQAQQVALSVSVGPTSAGGKAVASISMVSSGSARPSALQWTLRFPPAMIVDHAASGLAAVTAGKSILCSAPSDNSLLCLLYGLNDAEIRDGVLATVTFKALPEIPENSLSIELDDVAASTGDGLSISSGGSETSLQVTAPVAVTEMTCPGTVMAPAIVPCSITTAGSLPGDATVMVESSIASVIVPASITIAPGEHTATFNAIAGADAAGKSVTITATSGSSTARAVSDITSGGNSVLLFNAASYSTDLICSPGSVVSAFGSGFTDGSSAPASATGPLPTMLDGVQVMIRGNPAPLYYVSPGQVNFQCPSGDPGDLLDITLRTPAGDKAAVNVPMRAATPGLYSMGPNGTGPGTILIAGTGMIATTPSAAEISGRPVKPGEFLEIYGNGFGITDRESTPGTPAPSDQLLHAANPIRVMIGGVEAIPTFAGLAPGTIGLYQIDVMIPIYSPSGNSIPLSTRIYLADGSVVDSNTVTIAIASSEDTAEP
jgi:uncharacterized protein (TIGR03437 family)